MADEPDLRQGSTDTEWVTYLQELLRTVGYDVVADGDFGAATDQAVRRFQESAGLTVDGWVGPITWPALVAAAGGDAGGSGSATPAGAGGAAPAGDVPQELVDRGFPADMTAWNDEQRTSVFVGKDYEGDTEDGGYEPVELLAINDSGDNGEAWA
jgi:peptidoglycan hydrolase-like protein with peptidoglycan-binding domain